MIVPGGNLIPPVIAGRNMGQENSFAAGAGDNMPVRRMQRLTSNGMVFVFFKV